MLHKIGISIRVPARWRKRFSQEVIRLTVHPLLYLRTRGMVRWNHDSPGSLAAIDLVEMAARRYPQLSLSSAVEIQLIDLLLEGGNPECALTPDEEEQMARFSALPLLEKIRITQKRMREFRMLKSLE